MQSPVKSSAAMTLTEMFPVNISVFPPLTAYQLKVRNGDVATIGGKLSYRLQKAFSGHWAWTSPWIVTDTTQSESALIRLIEQAWREDPETFRGFVALQSLPVWQPTAQVYADFAARCLWPELRSASTRLLNQWGYPLGMVQISRSCEVRGWVVQGEPAISISLDSRLMMKQNVQTYLSQASSSDAVIDLLVADRESTLKGIVTGIAGMVAEHRGRLLNIVGTSPSRVHIQEAKDDETVVQVYGTNRSTYDYVARGLQIVVRTSDYTRFNVNGRQATAQLRLAPQKRAEMMGQLALLAKNKGLIGDAYRSTKYAQFFLTATSVKFAPSLTIGNRQRITDVRDRTIQTSLQHHGFYKRVVPDQNSPLHIGVPTFLPIKIPSKQKKNFNN